MRRRIIEDIAFLMAASGGIVLVMKAASLLFTAMGCM